VRALTPEDRSIRDLIRAARVWIKGWGNVGITPEESLTLLGRALRDYSSAEGGGKLDLRVAREMAQVATGIVSECSVPDLRAQLTQWRQAYSFVLLGASEDELLVEAGEDRDLGLWLVALKRMKSMREELDAVRAELDTVRAELDDAQAARLSIIQLLEALLAGEVDLDELKSILEKEAYTQ
jgi:hypothetical protein